MCDNNLPEDFSLEEYGRELYNRRNEAVELGWADCDNEEWIPTENNCHINVSELCSVNHTLQPIRGWLFFDLEGINRVQFVAHSVVRDSAGMYYDITPPNNIQRPPFIIAIDDEEFFEQLVINIGDFFYEPDI